MEEYYNNLDEGKQLFAVKNNPLNIKYIKNPSYNVQLEALKRFRKSVKNYGNPIEYFIKVGIIPNENIQLEAVKQNGLSIEYIIKAGIIPNENIQLEAVKQNGLSIKYIIKAGIIPSYNVYIEALKQNNESKQYITLFTYFKYYKYLF